MGFYSSWVFFPTISGSPADPWHTYTGPSRDDAGYDADSGETGGTREKRVPPPLGIASIILLKGAQWGTNEIDALVNAVMKALP